jgi:hypothetical protein
MYTSHIGQRLLALYNQRTSSSLTARQFFEECMYPVFFQPAKYLQWVPNSPFAQAVAARDLVPGGPTAAEIRLTKLHRNIETVAPDASFVIGFPAAGVEGTTSGQVSNVGPVVGSEEIYCSWIGGALGIGVSGGLSLLLDEEDVLWTLYQGWAHYREFLKQRPDLKGNQIDTWNGQWLTYAFSEEFDRDHPADGLSAFKQSDTAGVLALDTAEWVQVLFALAQRLGRDLTAYVYGFGKSNRTIGFVPLKLTKIGHLCDLEESLFFFSDTLRSEGRSQLLKLYTTQYSFAYACQQGAIGMAALKPERIQDYIGENQKNEKSLLTADGKLSIHFAFYQIWIIAMLDRPGIDKAADRLAHTLLGFTQANKRASKENVTAVQKLWKTKGRKGFVDALIDILALLDREQGRQVVAELEEAVSHANVLPFDQLPYFVTLTHFRYLAASLKLTAEIPTTDN